MTRTAMIPRATYRLQFRNGMDFDRATTIVPYLRRLGVSHLYASPIFSATRGSSHGYDVIDPNSFDPALGGADGFARLRAALRNAQIGLILDIVPNHMAASLENEWWRSVVEWGSESPYAAHFDIDWSRRLTLPVLGRSYEEALAAGELSIRLDAQNGALTLAYFDTCFPLHPRTYGAALAGNALAEAVGTEAPVNASEADQFHRGISGLLNNRAAASTLQALLDERSRDPTYIDEVHKSQPWQLICWKDARRQLSYRRFFEVTGLVGLRVEDDRVFDEVHALTFELVRSGVIDGLRVDHVDGLADPTGYLGRLRRELGDNVYLLVEKILGHDEQLPGEWPISGTTGYEFISAMSQLLVDPKGALRLEQSYRLMAGEEASLETQRHEAKRLILFENFEGELTRLVQLARTGALEKAAISPNNLREAIGALICAFPVYRTYGDRRGMPARDRDLVLRVHEKALAEHPQLDRGAMECIAHLLIADIPQSAAEIAGEFRVRFQQLTGPVMAKAVEDTLFYRWNAMIALNEVGGDPEHLDGSMERFHRSRLERPPQFTHGLLATATHDTKRGEDARARLYALAEIPEEWTASLADWRSMNSRNLNEVGTAFPPEPELQWLIYQALAGVWPAANAPFPAATLEDLEQRMLAYIEKAMREAKLRTGWTDPNAAYEASVKTYVSKLLRPDNASFQEQFSSALRPVILAGALNALVQTLVKFTAPGIPDIYQGSELSDFSLVDPDNRRAVDFDLLTRELDHVDGDELTEEALLSGRAKLRLISKCLELRGANPRLFELGDYREVAVIGTRKEHAMAFERVLGADSALIIVSRFHLRHRQSAMQRASADLWGDTHLKSPWAGRSGSSMRNVLTGDLEKAADYIYLGRALASWPVGLFIGQ